MSLIGSLEDLGLGDILQIISLSQKSGILSIRGEQGDGCIVLCDGLVRGGHLKGGPSDLRGVLVDGKFLSGEEFDGAFATARREGTTIEEALEAETSMTVERIDSLRRECVEAAVMAMFSWPSGEFSFDVSPDGDEEFLLPIGVNAQYLAMEATRISDESNYLRAGGEVEDEDDFDPFAAPGDGGEELSAEELFGVVPTPADEEDALLGLDADAGFAGSSSHASGADEIEDGDSTLPEIAAEPLLANGEAADVLAAAVLERVDGDPDAGAGELLEAVPLAEAAAESDSAAETEPEAPAPVKMPPLVVIDSDLVALEWIKKSLDDSCKRIHIFQRWDLGLNPIRQYLARAVRPVVLVRRDAEGDPLSGIRNASDFVARLKVQQPKMTILWLESDREVRPANAGQADGFVTRPSNNQLRDARAALQLSEVASTLRGELLGHVARSSPAPGTSAGDANGAAAAATAGPDPIDSEKRLRRLKEVTEQLSHESSRGEVLPLVIRFASEIFDRVALFMVRGDSVVGIAESGLQKSGGPNDAGLREMELRRDSCHWFREVFASGGSIRAPASGGGDYTLAARLGNAAADEAYLAAIESSGEVVALLYADNLPTGRALGDVEDLEVVLHQAGMHLERSMLERALAEAEA